MLIRLNCLLLLLIASSASAVTIEWVTVGNPGNPCDPQPNQDFCYGAVGYSYQISKYEISLPPPPPALGLA